MLVQFVQTISGWLVSDYFLDHWWSLSEKVDSICLQIRESCHA